MHSRSLGATGARISEISMGCNRLGEEQMPDAHWIELVQQAVDRGVTLFDTSESYGWGRSEEILGQALGNRHDVYIATKVSRVRETDAKTSPPIVSLPAQRRACAVCAVTASTSTSYIAPAWRICSISIGRMPSPN